MKKNLELTYKNNEIKLNKKNYLTIITPILLVLILIIGIAVFVSVTNSHSNKLKNYLEEIGYTCNKKTCSKEIEVSVYTINYKDMSMYVDNESFRLTIGNENPIIELKSDEYICTYTKSNYSRFTLIDDSFIYEKKCEDYIEKVNNYIKEYKQIVNSSGVDVNKLEK